ncbi:MAG: 50S ribosomal protein L25 [Rhodopirellula sp.]|nr:50S ribosomal protein L25 [Rhodopirellula sp.]|tara:strand:- start:37633 stop:38238 length:606 start_codon:yes stop_codon:yes gene_type:complete
MAELFQAEARELTGSANTRRLRRAGMVPAILYGQGKDVVHLSIPESQVNSAVRNNQPYIQLEGASTESAQIQELQWDALGSTVLHVDLTRMDANAMIEVDLTISLTGDARASINQIIRTTTAVVPAMNIPNGLVANISSLNDGDSISLGDIELPEKVSLLSDPSTVVVTCGAVAASETPAEEATVTDDAGSNETEESGGDE